MEWSKLKNVIILILLIVNGFLLVQVAGQEWKSARYQEQARTGAIEVLERGGISVDRGILPRERALRPMVAERDRAGEAAMAEALLEQAEKIDDKGRDAYRGTKGEAIFRSDGSFSVTFEPGAWGLDGASPAAHGTRLLSDAGYPCTALRATAGTRADTIELEVRQDLGETPLFNCTATLTYEGGSLRGIEGQRLIGAPAATAGELSFSVPTMLTRFLTGVREGGYMCGSITALTAGYRMTLETSGQARLLPSWQVVTDIGTFYMDGRSGTVEEGPAG